MKAVNMNEEDMRKEIETDLSLNMFVEAGAGAGKTTLIVRRIVNMLSGDVEPGEIVVITFTNAAAEELRGRIMDKVSERAKDDPKLEDKLHRLNDMNISTIHSFCNVLLHEQGLVTKLPIDIEMLQGDDEKKIKKEYFDAFLKEELSKEDWDKLEEKMGKNGTRYRIRENMEYLYMQMTDLPEDTNIIIPDAVDEDRQKQAMDILRSVVMGDPAKGIPTLEKRLIDALNSCVKPEKKEEGFKEADTFSEAAENYCGKGKVPFMRDISDVLLNDHTVENENKVYRALLKTKDCSLLSESKNNYKVIINVDKIPKANEMISESINSMLNDDVRSLLPDLECKDEDKKVIAYEDALKKNTVSIAHGITVATYAKKARDYYRKNAKKNRITNERLLELARDLILNKDKSALEYFSKKYTRFFVDEFQDTDRIQESFIYRLASEVDDETRLREGALFVVGDPKQSIYRFRGAQPAVYFSTKEKMEKLDNARVYELAYNYRSNRDVIEWVNEKFSDTEDITPIVDENGISYRYQSMEVKKEINEENNVLHGIYHIGYPDAERYIGTVIRHLTKSSKPCDGYIYNEGRSDEDIQNVIDLILDLTKKDEKGKGYFKITDYDNDHKPYIRDIRRSDFLLISHNKKMMYDYVSAMKRRGIAVVLDGEEDMRADKGLVVFVRLYQYLVNPRDPFYRTGAEEALRETLHIKSEKELHELSQRILDCLYEDAKSMCAYGMAEYLERQVSVLFDKGTDVSHVDALSSQTHIRQMIENLCMNVTGTGIEMAEAMQKYLDTKLEHELSMEEEPDAAVRFMNLHKTKGLEGNIVIILDRNGKRDHSPTSCTDGKNFYPGKDKFWTSLNDYPKTKEDARKSENAEFHRLEYVAVTRAAQVVIFMDVLTKNGLFAKKKLDSSIKKDELDENLQNLTIYQKQKEDTFSYRIVESVNIREKVNSVIPNDRLKNKPYEAENPETYPAKRDDYPEEKIQEVKTAGMVVKNSPSGLEKGYSPKKNAVIEKAKKEGRKRSDEYNWGMIRPVGNVTGEILHRTMELLVGRRFAGSGICIEDSVCQAVDENRDRLYVICENLKKNLIGEGYPEKASEITEEKTKDIVIGFVNACAKAYDAYLDEIWQDVANVYPEVRFSYRNDDENDKSVTVWMNGTADLIIEMKDGTYRLIDYKSDNDFFLSEEEMKTVLTEKYTPQLDVYRSVIRTILDTAPENIKTGIISFSQKDKTGAILKGKEVRVRYTEI